MYFLCICDVLTMYCVCIRDVSWMYYDCNIHVSLMYYGCIGSCAPHLCFPPYSSHHLLGAQPIRYPVLGISSPWVWLLLGGGSLDMAAPDMLFGRQGMHVPACPVGCCPAETTAGQASTRGPYTPCSRPETLGCCWGPNRAQKTVKSTS